MYFLDAMGTLISVISVWKGSYDEEIYEVHVPNDIISVHKEKILPSSPWKFPIFID